MFVSRYEYIPLEDLIVIYYEKLEEYKREMENAFFRQLHGLKTIGIAGRDSLEEYETTMKRIDEKRYKTYEYVIDPKTRMMKATFAHSMIMQQIYKNIWKREQEGIDQTDIRMELQKFFNDDPTVGGYEVFKELFVEANTQLGFFKLPEEFMKYKDLIYK